VATSYNRAHRGRHKGGNSIFVFIIEPGYLYLIVLCLNSEKSLMIVSQVEGSY
jgi:hypothetical protein